MYQGTSDLTYIQTEILGNYINGNQKDAVRRLNELNPLQSAYVMGLMFEENDKEAMKFARFVAHYMNAGEE